MIYLLSVITMFALLTMFTLYGYKKGIDFPDGEALINKRDKITKEESGTTFFIILISSLIPVLGASFFFAIGLMYACHFLYTKILTTGGNALGGKIANLINNKVLKNGK